jgi:tetratricopeptide (TPR) repeat protein
MARAAVKAKQQARAKAAQPAKSGRGRRGHASGGNPNQNLFFTRLRRRQKWVFLLLAIVFALAFAGIGVGSGNGGGLSQLYSGLFGGSGASSISKAQAEVKTNPAKGYRDLASAYIQKSDLPDAEQALQSYLKINTKDAGMWQQLGGLEQQQGNTYAQQYQAAEAATQAADPGQSFAVTGTLGTQLGTNPIDQYYSQTASTQTSQLYGQATSAYAASLKAYQTAARIHPNNANGQFGVYQAAVNDGKYPVALAALKKYVALDPHSPELTQIEKACKQLGGSCKPASAKKK